MVMAVMAADNSLRLTLPSPLVSSWLNTLSACAVLVPPAPSAFSNSDFEIWPSPLPSICENRSCSAADWLVGVDEAVVVVDWLCAASNACIVAGDICEPPPENPVVLVAPEAWPDMSKGSAKPVEEALDLVEEVLVEEVADEVSD
jgi:hypothetical protein